MKRSQFLSRAKIVLLFFSIIIVILCLANIIFSCHLATSGESLKDFDKEIQRLEKDNEILQSKVIALSSYAALSQKAAQLGFVKPSTIIYLKGQTPLAMR